MSWVMIILPNNTRLTWGRDTSQASFLSSHWGSQGDESLAHLRSSQKVKAGAMHFPSSDPISHPSFSSQTLSSSPLKLHWWPTNSVCPRCSGYSFFSWFRWILVFPRDHYFRGSLSRPHSLSRHSYSGLGSGMRIIFAPIALQTISPQTSLKNFGFCLQITQMPKRCQVAVPLVTSHSPSSFQWSLCLWALGLYSTANLLPTSRHLRHTGERIVQIPGLLLSLPFSSSSPANIHSMVTA